MEEKGWKKLWTLFSSTFYLSSCTFGGGYVILSFMKKIFVDKLKWIDEEEMMDLIAIAQSSPGAIAVNGAIVVGYKIYGIPGIIAAVLGSVFPPFIILSVVTVCYNAFSSNFYIQALLRGMQAGVAAVIVSVSIDMGRAVLKGQKKWLVLWIIAATFAVSYFLKMNSIWIVLFFCLAGAISVKCENRRRKS